MDNFSLVKGQHCLIFNSKQEISRSENGIFVMDKISGLVYDLPLSPEVMSFFDICTTENSAISEATEVNSSCSNSNQNDESLTDYPKSGGVIWDEKAVKLLFSLYADHQDDFKSTSIKNDVVWNKIRRLMNVDGGYNFTKIQVKDKWTNIRKAYMRVKDHNKGTGVTPKTYRYYDEMDNIYGDKPNVNPVAIASNMRAENMTAEDDNISAKESAIDDSAPKKKKSKVEHQLSCWTEKFIQHSNEREVRREKRQVEKIAATKDATNTFRDVMEKLIDKL